jgi:hypothetical protein
MRAITVTKEHDDAKGLTVLKVLVDGQSLKTQWTDQAAVDIYKLHGLTLAEEIQRVWFVELTNVLTAEERQEALRQLNLLSPKETP